MIVRKATSKDFEQLRDLEKEFFLWECKTDPRLDPNYAKRGIGIRLRQQMNSKNFKFFVAEQNNIIGFLSLQIKKNPALVKEKKQGYIYNLYVKPKFRNKSIGKKLIKQSMDWMKSQGIREIFLSVYDHNPRAKKLYRKLGFKDYMMEMLKN